MDARLVDKYRDLFSATGHGGLYNDPWWLDLVCGPGGWTTLSGSDQVTGASVYLPAASLRIRGLGALVTPPLTQWVRPIGTHGVCTGLPGGILRSIPACPIVDLQVGADWEASADRHGFHASTRYSYVLPANLSMEEIRAGYNEGLRRNLREAKDHYSVATCEDPTLLHRLVRVSHERQQQRLSPWIESALPRVTGAILAAGRGACLAAFADGQVLAAILVAWDDDTTYYLAGGHLARPGSASAHALLLDRAIDQAIDRRTGFDFEGSMHPGIANFFQSFGARPAPFLRLVRYRGLGRLWGWWQG